MSFKSNGALTLFRDENDENFFFSFKQVFCNLASGNKVRIILELGDSHKMKMKCCIWTNARCLGIAFGFLLQ